MSITATKVAFDVFRALYGPEWGPRFLRLEAERDQIGADDGLVELVDGPGPAVPSMDRLSPFSLDNLPEPVRLWVVRSEEVLHAQESCKFGQARADDGRIKHTNLTAGQPAFSGGELIFLGGNTLVVSGNSGRYGPRNAMEMQDVAIAFRDSGYTVYSTGYDQEANRALPLVGPAPKLI